MKCFLPFFIILFSAISLHATVKVACVGDSITYGMYVWNRKENCYPAKLQRMLGDGYEVRNFGLNSATASSWGDRPYMKNRKYRESLDFQPDIVLLMFGTNDSKSFTWKGAEAFGKELSSLVETYRSLSSHPTIYVLTPPPAFKDSYFIRNGNINEELPVIAALGDVHIIDMHSFLSTHREWFGWDGIHPTAAGTFAMATFLKTTLQEI